MGCCRLHLAYHRSHVTTTITTTTTTFFFLFMLFFRPSSFLFLLLLSSKLGGVGNYWDPEKRKGADLWVPEKGQGSAGSNPVCSEFPFEIKFARCLVQPPRPPTHTPKDARTL